MLAGAVEGAASGRRRGLQLSEAQRDQLGKYEALCRDVGESPANVALAWLIHNPVVTAPTAYAW